jgi:predicted amidohydrolase YtcJ
MKFHILFIFTFFIQKNHAQEYAEIIFINGNIITMESATNAPEAMAVKNGKILALDTQAEIMKFKGKKTEVIDLNGKTLMPAFIDAHSHFGTSIAFTSGMVKLYPQPFGNVMSIEDLITTVKKYIEDNHIKPGKPIVGWGYDDAVIGRHPTREDINKISTQHPIYVVHTSGHMGVGNDMALKEAGIDQNTPNPTGGNIVKDSSGDPTGLLEENINIKTIMRFFTVPGPRKLIKAINQTQQQWLSYGQTTACEGRITDKKLWLLLKTANTIGLLKIDLVVLPDYDYFKNQMPDLKGKWSVYKKHLKVGGIKFSQDGSPQGKTAWLTHAYLHPPHGQDSSYLGYPIYSDSALKAGIEKVFKVGFTFHSHNNGDAAIDQLIRILTELKNEGKYHGSERVVLVHAQTVRADQLVLLKELGVIPSFYSLHPYAWGDWHINETLGMYRAERISPTATALKQNILFTIHHDSPVVPPNTIILLWSTVNRITRSGYVLGNEQISTYEALKALTINAAYQWGEENNKGSLKVGKLADLIVLSDNPLKMEPTQLNELKILKTFKNGKLLYQSSKQQ